jgi:glucose-6-phosphate 1-epimerase
MPHADAGGCTPQRLSRPLHRHHAIHLPMSNALTLFDGQPAITIKAPDGASATLLVHGGHIVSWQPAGGEEMLYLSPKTPYGDGASVRGGVPVVFPQFSTRGPLPRHGFARNRTWKVLEHDRRGTHAYAVLGLSDDESTRALWPHAFELELTVSVDAGRLDMELAVINTGETTFGFHAALHTYLRCADVRKTQLEGLLDQSYLDQVSGEERGQWIDVISIAQEVDRIYWNTPAQLTLRETGRRLGISQQGFIDTVVWNPGPERCAAMPDMPPEGWLDMLCVEAAQVGEPIHIGPGEEWSGMQTLQAF